jgi:hypothetical protein
MTLLVSVIKVSCHKFLTIRKSLFLHLNVVLVLEFVLHRQHQLTVSSGLR